MAIHKEIYLARHGETTWNLQHRFQGQIDRESVLTTKGEEQARTLGEQVSHLHFDIIYTSKLKRAQDTALIVQKYLLKTPIKYWEDLNERHFGSLQGKTMYDVGIQNYATAGADLYALETGILADAEKLKDLSKRIQRFKEYVLKSSDQRILVIGHVSWNSYFINALFQEKTVFHPQKNGSFHYFKIDEPGKVLEHKLDTTWSEIPRSF